MFMSNYSKPSITDIRMVNNAFGVYPASKVMKMRARATKMILMDYATNLIDERKLPQGEVTAKLERAVNNAIEKGLCTEAVLTPLMKLVNKKFTKIDPVLKLHYATTLEVLEELGGKGSSDVSVLPEEIQEASECGPECFGYTAPSMESLITTTEDPRKRMISLVGGAISSQIMQQLNTEALDTEYMQSR